MAARPASGTTWGFVHFFARSSRHILAEEGTRFIYSPIHLAFHFDIRHQFKSALTTTIIKTSRQKSNLSSAFDISSRRSQQNIYIDVRERRPLRPRRACCSAARPHRFADATLLNLRCVEHVAPRHARITLLALRLRNPAAPRTFAPRHARITLRLLRLRNPAAPSAFAPRHPASFCGCYAYDTLPC